MLENKFYKVHQGGGSLITADFYNPITGEIKVEVVRDYDYYDCSRDNDELYNMPIDTEARIAWLHSKGIIVVGDTVKVVKGRKVAIGTVANVTEIKPYYDRYGRWVSDYAYLDNGERTNVNNCKLA